MAGNSRPVFLSILTSEISAIIASATLSVHFDQASTTLLYFSPWVIRPSRYCCSNSFTTARVALTMSHLFLGITMSSLPNEIPALNASVKPRDMIRSQKMTDSFWPQWR